MILIKASSEANILRIKVSSKLLFFLAPINAKPVCSMISICSWMWIFFISLMLPNSGRHYLCHQPQQSLTNNPTESPSMTLQRYYVSFVETTLELPLVGHISSLIIRVTLTPHPEPRRPPTTPHQKLKRSGHVIPTLLSSRVGFLSWKLSLMS